MCFTTPHAYRNDDNDYTETAPATEINNTSYATSVTYATISNEQKIKEEKHEEPTYDKIVDLTRSLPAKVSADLHGPGYAIPVKKPKLKPPIEIK